MASPRNASLEWAEFWRGTSAHALDRRERVGGAYAAFERFSRKLQDVTRKEADRARVVGDALLQVAEAIEQGAEDIKATYLGAAGMLVTAQSLFAVPATVAGVVVVAAEALLSVYGVVKQHTDAAARTAASQTESKVSISRPKIMAETPREALSKYSYHGRWLYAHQR